MAPALTSGEVVLCDRFGKFMRMPERGDLVLFATNDGLFIKRIVGMPGEEAWHARETLDIVLDVGTDGLKLHPLHVVKGTQLANEWRRGEYQPLSQEAYVDIAADLIERTPWDSVYHRVTGTAPACTIRSIDRSWASTEVPPEVSVTT